MTNPEAATAPVPRLRRWRRRLAWTGGIFAALVVLIALLGPTVISSVGRGVIVSTLNDSLNGKAELASFSFNWSGEIRLKEFKISDAAGEPAVTTKEVALDVDIWKAVGGTYIATLRVIEPVIHARRDANGNLNLDSLMKPRPPTPTEPPGAPAPLPRMKATLTVVNGQTILTDAATAKTETTDLNLDFTLDTINDPAQTIDLPALLRGTVGQAKLNLPGMSMTGLAARGGVTVDVKDSHARTDTHLDVNGGTADVKADVDFRNSADAISSFSTSLKGVEANAAMSPLLSMIHPIFAVAGDATQGALGGTIDCDLSFAHQGPLPAEIAQGWDALPKKPINGKGHFQIRRFSLTGSPLLGALGNEALDGLELNPIDFTISDGRLSYDRPMRMKLSGYDTQWTGSVGLDQTLDLTWEVPAALLASKISALKSLGDQKVRIPVKGTSTSPTLDIEGAVSGLLKNAVTDTIGEKITEGIGEKAGDLLGGLLGGGDKEKEAQELLEQADRLYDAGDRAQAGVLYRKIHAEYRKSAVYRNNKDRINARE